MHKWEFDGTNRNGNRFWRSAISNFPNLMSLSSSPYVEEQRNHDPKQYRLIGFAAGRLISFTIEYRKDILGSDIGVVTAWHATLQEQRAYEREVY